MSRFQGTCTPVTNRGYGIRTALRKYIPLPLERITCGIKKGRLGIFGQY
jgi:hypothetical protein